MCSYLFETSICAGYATKLTLREIYIIVKVSKYGSRNPCEGIEFQFLHIGSQVPGEESKVECPRSWVPCKGPVPRSRLWVPGSRSQVKSPRWRVLVHRFHVRVLGPKSHVPDPTFPVCRVKCQKQPLIFLCKKGIFRNFAKFHRKETALKSLFNRLQTFRLAALLKRNSNTVVFL